MFALVAVALGLFVFWQPREPARVLPQKAPRSPVEALEATAQQFDFDLTAATAAAKAARAAGTLKPLASTPDEFARALGGVNFRMVDFALRFEEPPVANTAAFAAYNDELKQLTDDLANLLSDDSFIETEDTQKSLAHHQALMASGALGLDEAATTKLEALIAAAYEKTFPTLGDRALTEAEKADFDKAFDAMTADLEQQIRPLLSPTQTSRLDVLGLEQVLFGLGE